MYPRPLRAAVIALVCGCTLQASGIAAAASGGLQAPAPPLTPLASATEAPAEGNALDAFMRRVLARRDVNRETLDLYVLDEVERFELYGPGRMPIHRGRREYTWYVRDGMHVRSPLRFDGVALEEAERERYESEWIRRERDRSARKAQGRNAGGAADAAGPQPPLEPRFVSEAYFLDFKFEAGHYYLAGHDALEGHDVIRVEYYPARLFADDEDETRTTGGRDRRRENAEAQDLERKMNKTALVTLWIDPAEYQIVKYTFENVWLDFLPGSWLVRMDGVRASMTMGQPFPGVWLPRGLQVEAGASLAAGAFEVAYSRQFSDYRLAEVSTRMRVPGSGGASATPSAPVVVPLTTANIPGVRLQTPEVAATPGAESGASARGLPVVREIRVHGNAVLSDAQVIALGGIAAGDVLHPGAGAAVARRLRESGRFEAVEVRERSRGLTSGRDVALVLLVHEKPGVRPSDEAGIPSAPGPLSRFRGSLLFLPIVGYAEGYGFTYGGRVSAVDLLGAGERLSVPLTWGGTRRAALEVDRQFDRGPVTRLSAAITASSREHPRFDERDRRAELSIRAERVFLDRVRAGVEAGRSRIGFGTLDDRLWTVGASALVDTRLDPNYPANAVLLGVAWTGLHFRDTSGRIDRYQVDLRGYARLYRQIVLAGRTQYVWASRPLPPYERPLLGGASTLRGFRAGAFEGDRTLVASGELRVPVTSVLSGMRLGVTAFVDAGTAWDAGQTLQNAPWEHGTGAGLFLVAPFFRLNVDVARAWRTGDVRAHVSTGFGF